MQHVERGMSIMAGQLLGGFEDCELFAFRVRLGRLCHNPRSPGGRLC